MKTQNNLAKAGSSWKSHFSRCGDQLLRVPLCKVQSLLFLNILSQPIAALGGKQNTLISPSTLHVLDPHVTFAKSTFWGRLVAHGCRRCPVRKHRVFQWCSQVPLADPHCHRMDRYSAAVWRKAGNDDSLRISTSWTSSTRPSQHLVGPNSEIITFPTVFKRVCCGP